MRPWDGFGGPQTVWSTFLDEHFWVRSIPLTEEGKTAPSVWQMPQPLSALELWFFRRIL